MKERINLINLYDTYKNLLTKKQQEYFEYYYFEDNSLSEIADNLGVSKTIVGKTSADLVTIDGELIKIIDIVDINKI